MLNVRFGLNDNSDNKFDVNIQYRLGESLSSQLNTDNVRAMRLMSGNRYDFVDRNNDIVLEYKKKTLVFLSINPTLNGYAKEEKDLGVQVRSKYPVKQIEWSASRLITNGGKINHNNNLNYSIILPRHISGSTEKNSYIISAVAIDEQGNRSDPVQSQIIVDQSAINTQNSQFTPKATQLPADNHSVQNLTLSILDNDNLPVDIDIKELSLQVQSDNPISSSQVSHFSQIDTGKYQATLRAGSSPEIVTLTPKFRDNTFNQAQVTFVADTHSAIIPQGGLIVIKNHAPADGKSQNKIQVIVTDINANRIPNYPVSFTADNGATIIKQANTNSEGKVIVPITNTHIGESIINASIKNTFQSTNVNFIADISSAKINTFTINPNSSFANGTDEKRITFNVIDKNNNPVPNAKIQLSADNQAQLKDTELLTDNQGDASTIMTSKISGTVTVTALVNNVATQKTTKFIADLSNGKIISVTSSAPPYIADGKKTVTFTAVVEDKNHNILPNAKVIWSTNRDQNIVAIDEISTTNNQGIAQTTVTSTQAFDVIVTANISNGSLDASPITFIADNQKGLITLTANKTQIIADNKEQAILTAVVKDKFGNKLPNVAVEWQSNASATLYKQKTITDNQGQTTNQIRTKKAGVTDIIATLENKEKAQITLKAIADPHSANIVLTTINNKTEAIADNNDTITLVAHVTDAENNPLIKQAVFWHSSHNMLSANMVKTDDNGDVKIEIKGTEALSTTVTATLENNRNATQNLHFIAGQADASQSTFSIEPQSIVANGQTVATGKITLKDKFGNPVPKQENFIALSGDNTTIQFSAIQEIKKEFYQTTIKGKQEGISTISAQYSNTNNSFTLTQPLGFVADTQNAIIQSVNVIAPYTVTANGHDSVIIKAHIVDKQGNPSMEGITVGWKTLLGQLSPLPISKTDKHGVAEITLTSTQAGTAKVTAMLDAQESLKADHDIIFITDAISATRSTLALSPSIITAGDGTQSHDQSDITVIAKDNQGNLLTGLKDDIKLQYSTNLNIKESKFTESSTGVYKATVSAQKVGTTQIHAAISSVTLTQSASLTVIADNVSAKVRDIVISDPAPKAGDTITYTAYLIDKYDNPVSKDTPVTWTSDNVSVLSSALTFTDDKGVTQTKLTRGPAGLAKVNVILKSGIYHAKDINFVADDVDENRSEINLVPATIIANGTDKALLTLTIKDKGGNILPDQQVKGISNNPTIVFSPAQQVSPGHYEIEATGTKSGTAQLSVNINGIDFKKQKTLQLHADATTWQVKSVDVDRTTMIAGDKGVNYQATIVDANDNILSNIIVSWKLQGLANDYDFSTYTDANGIARTKITSNVAGILKMSAYLDLSNHKPIQDVTVIPADIDTNKSTFSSSRQSIGGDDKDSTTLTVKLVDQYGNAISGKNVTLDKQSGTPHFSDNPLKSLGNGEYQTQLTSNVKTDIVLSAIAEGVTIAKPVKVTVTIPKPDIIFDKQIQQETFISTPINALGYKGLPNNINVMWSSSAPDIASIDNRSGAITLKKAGTTIITLQTSGNDQYQPTQNSYPLVIEKASPNLKITSSPSIKTVWKDGSKNQIQATFNNQDAKNIALHFSSKNTAIATVDEYGNIQEVTPGQTIIQIQSEATEQFLADIQNINYTQDKASLTIHFDQKDITMLDTETNISAQEPNPLLPPEAQFEYSAQYPQLISITHEGTIISVKPGESRVYLKIIENKYYNSSQGSYNVRIRSLPYVTLISAKRRIDNVPNSSSAITQYTPTAWTPIYEGEDFALTWKVENTQNVAGYAINVELWSGNKNIEKYEYKSTDLLNSKTQTTHLGANKQFINSNDPITLRVTVYDFADNNKAHPTDYPLNVQSISPQYMDLELSGLISFILTNNGKQTSNCQEDGLSNTTHVILRPRISVGYSSKKLLMPVTVSHKLIRLKGSYSRDTVDYQDRKEYTISEENNLFTQNSARFAMKEQCWATTAGANAHKGTGLLVTYVTINNVTGYYTQQVKWDGDGTLSENIIFNQRYEGKEPK